MGGQNSELRANYQGEVQPFLGGYVPVSDSLPNKMITEILSRTDMKGIVCGASHLDPTSSAAGTPLTALDACWHQVRIEPNSQEFNGESADTDSDHIHRGQDKSENCPKRFQKAPPEGE